MEADHTQGGSNRLFGMWKAYEKVDKDNGLCSNALCTRRGAALMRIGMLVGLLVTVAVTAASTHPADQPRTPLPSPPLESFPPPASPPPPLPRSVHPQESPTETPPNSTCAWERLAASASACTGVNCGADDAFDAPIYRCMHEGVRSLLVGPFSSSVQQWYSIVATVPLLRRGDRITRYTGDAVGASDASTTISYPPLHVHHIHVWHPESDSGHWWETHGDYVRVGDGRYDYSLASPPAGRCVVYDEDKPLKIDAVSNDFE